MHTILYVNYEEKLSISFTRDPMHKKKALLMGDGPSFVRKAAFEMFYQPEPRILCSLTWRQI